MFDFKLKTELYEAVSLGVVRKVKDILHEIPAVDEKVKDELGLLLHHDDITFDIAKELLLFGANVRKFNGMRDSSLHSAIDNHKNPELIELLLKYGASTDSSNRRGNTPLYVALKKKNRDLNVIKLLLEYGADINIVNRERRVYGDHYTSLEYSMFDLASVKLLVKFTLFKNFKDDYKAIINLDSLKTHRNYIPVSTYFADCVSEMTVMSQDMVSDKLSLYELFLYGENSKVLSLNLTNAFADLVFIRLINCSYPIYQDVILSSHVARISLMLKINSFQFFSSVNSNNIHSEIFLNKDSVNIIAKYLSNNDLLNLIVAFNFPNQKCADADHLTKIL